MSGSSFGKLFRITTWGESHGPAVGVVIDGCPAGISLSEEDIQVFLDRRRPGQSRYTTRRNESDTVEILSGVFEGKTTGTPISLMVRNQDQRSKDYGNIAVSYRPGHADYPLKKNTVSGITAEEGVLPAVKPSEESRLARLHHAFSMNWEFLSAPTQRLSVLLPWTSLNMTIPRSTKTVSTCPAMP